MNTETKAVFPDISAATATLSSYKKGKRELEARLLRERESWRAIYAGGESSSWVFNSIVNKHADIIDSMPTCTCLPREKKDESDAEKLSKIIPVISERCNFEQTYSDNSYNKLKHGTAIYGVFWNNALEDGLGDVDIRALDISSVYWEPGISDIQDSKNLFIVGYCDTEQLEMLYPHFNYANEREGIEAAAAAIGLTSKDTGKCAVVDWYYKRYGEGGACILHYCKFVGNCLLYCSENDESCSIGWYEHGQYPVVFDNMYSKYGDVCGFGLMAVADKIQKDINRIDDNILNYSDWASHVRFWAKRSLGVNEKDFLNLDKSVVEVEGDIDSEKLRQIEIGALDGSVIDIKKLKVEELKEITGSRDVSQGGVTGGVTAASAINILRETGAKFSRDGIAETYRAYVRIMSLVIELIRQFYDGTRVFRIVGDEGEREYLEFCGRDISGTDGSLRPHFDIEVSASKKSPAEAQQKNEFAKLLYDAGVFDVANAKQSLMMLELMDFDGVGKLKASIRQALEEAENDESATDIEKGEGSTDTEGGEASS